MTGRRRAHDVRIYLHTGRLAHPYYREQISIAPPGCTYVPGHPELLAPDVLRREIAGAGSWRHAARARLVRAAVVAVTRSGVIVRRRVASPADVELIHSAQHLLRGTRVPYVVDCEDGHVFTYYQRGALERRWARKALAARLLDERCRAVLPFTQAARTGFLNALGDEAPPALAQKLKVVLPGIRPRRTRPREPSRRGPLRLLFVGTGFLPKGGVEAVAAVRRAQASCNVELDMVTLMSDERRSAISQVPGIRVHRKIPAQQIRALYEAADCLLFLSHIDTLGWTVMEGFSYGVPAIGTTHFSVPEMVEHGKSGLLIETENSSYGPDFLPRQRWPDPMKLDRSFLSALATPSERYVDEIAAAIVRLGESGELLEQLSHGALHRVTEGPLSPRARAESLGAVYAEATGRASS